MYKIKVNLKSFKCVKDCSANKLGRMKGLFCVKARFHYERGKKHSLFVLLIFFCARFNRRLIKERKNALFHARSGNGP